MLDKGSRAGKVETLRNGESHGRVANLNQGVRGHSDGEGEGSDEAGSEHCEEMIADEGS